MIDTDRLMVENDRNERHNGYNDSLECLVLLIKWLIINNIIEMLATTVIKMSSNH